MDKLGDKKSKFFHLSTIKRRRSNKIHHLKNGDGEWISNENMIMLEMFDYYSNMYRIEGSYDLDDTLTNMSRMVTEEKNQYLTRDVIDEEVRNRILSFGARRIFEHPLPKVLERCRPRFVHYGQIIYPHR